MEETIKAEMSDTGVYEVGFLFVPSITEEKMTEVFGAFKDSIIASGSTAIVAEEAPKLIPLAYTMEKTINNKIERFKEGWFGWVKFELDAALVAKLDAKIRLREDIIRHLFVSTTRDNTIASKRPFSVRRRPGSKDEVKGDKEVPEMSKEDIDREIEALVTEKEV